MAHRVFDRTGTTRRGTGRNNRRTCVCEQRWIDRQAIAWSMLATCFEVAQVTDEDLNERVAKRRALRVCSRLDH